jgi:hypothetical protein
LQRPKQRQRRLPKGLLVNAKTELQQQMRLVMSRTREDENEMEIDGKKGLKNTKNEEYCEFFHMISEFFYLSYPLRTVGLIL